MNIWQPIPVFGINSAGKFRWGRVGEPQDIARSGWCFWLPIKPSYITGATLRIDGGSHTARHA